MRFTDATDETAAQQCGIVPLRGDNYGGRFSDNYDGRYARPSGMIAGRGEAPTEERA